MVPPAESVWTVIIFATCLAYIAKLLKQPLIPAFILAGVLVGPVLHQIEEPVVIQYLAELTIVFVMFSAGLEMDLSRMKTLGRVVSLGGVLQFVVTGIIGFLISWIYLDWVSSIYLGILFSLASTALVINLLGERNQLDLLHGGISLGILLLQDMIAIVILSMLPAKDLTVASILSLALKSIGLVSLGTMLGSYVLPKLLRKVVSNPQLLMLVSLSVGALFAKLAISQGLSGAIGAFITGVALANAPNETGIHNRVTSLRDFFLPIFFASLGIQLKLPSLNAAGLVILLTVAGLTLKPLVIATITALFGFQRRTCWNVGTYLSPMSEFGLVIVALGITLKHVPEELMAVSIAVMTLSMVLSVYLSTDKLSAWILLQLGFLDRIGPKAKVEETLRENKTPHDVVLVGCRHSGKYVLSWLRKRGLRVLVIEIDYRQFLTLRRNGVECVLGDALLRETWDKISMDETKFVFSMIDELAQSKRLLDMLNELYPTVEIVLSASHTAGTHALMKQPGVKYVLCGHVLAGIMLLQGQLHKAIFGHDPKIAEQTIDHLERMMEEFDIPECHLPNNGNGNGNCDSSCNRK